MLRVQFQCCGAQASNKVMEDELTGKQMEVLAKMQFMREEHARRNKELK